MMNKQDSIFLERYRYEYIENMPDIESVDLLFNYSQFFNIPVTEETAYLLIRIAGGNPFYFNSVISSAYPGKNLTTVAGLAETLEFETLDDRGEIKSTWIKYIGIVFPNINDNDVKNIVLHLNKHRDREWTRDELREKLDLEIPDDELETKLKTIVEARIIKQGTSDFRYRGLNDNIFGKVFRVVYGEGIPGYDASSKVIREEYKRELEEKKKWYDGLPGDDPLKSKSPFG